MEVPCCCAMEKEGKDKVVTVKLKDTSFGSLRKLIV